MPILVSAKDIRKSFGVRPLFEDVTFVVESGERVGLIGPNGAGKSTLLRILAGKGSVDSGDLSFQRGLKIGFLEQTPVFAAGDTVETAIHAAGAEPSIVGEVLSRLELTALTGKSVETLSGGWRKRVALARELVKEPELLLLDEPTNHLDIESILWLEGFLARSSFATITVTHDRVFLKRVTNRILELDRRNPKGLLSVRGDYEEYLKRKTELLEQTEKRETVLKNTLRRETEWLRQGAKARTTKQQARIQAAAALKETVEELGVRNQHRSAKLDFQSTDKKPKRLVEGQGLAKRYGDRILFRNVDIFLGPGDRVGLLGNNGCGKSTLIRVLLGLEEADAGKVIRSEHLNPSYFEQNRETLDPNQTLRKTLCPHGDEVNYRGKMVHIHGYLDRFLFRKEQIDMPIRNLSGGEQSRVLIARLMLKHANLLILDEPTNDLDVETLDILQDCLTDFDGAILLVTHDRYFLDQVATQILAFEDGDVTAYADLNQWQNRTRNQNKIEKNIENAAGPDRAKKKKLSFNDAREYAGMEKRIQEAEAALNELQNASAAPEHQSNSKKLAELFQAIAEKQAELDRLYARWAELEAMA